MATALLEKNQELAKARDTNGLTPLMIAAQIKCASNKSILGMIEALATCSELDVAAGNKHTVSGKYDE